MLLEARLTTDVTVTFSEAVTGFDASDLVHIERTPSDSQLGHIRKKTNGRKAERAHLNAQSPRNNDWGTGLNQKR